MMPRVLVVDDDRMYAEAAAAVLSIDDRLEVVGFAAEGRQAVEQALELRPDVVVEEALVEAARSAGREAVTR